MALLCQPRHVWLSDANAILVDGVVGTSLIGAASTLISLRPVDTRWSDNAPLGFGEVPRLLEVCATVALSAAPRNIDRGDCVCGTLRRIAFDPLILHPPATPDVPDAAFLSENPQVLLLSEFCRDILRDADPDLEFSEVFFDQGD